VPGCGVSPQKLLFPVFRLSPAATNEKQGLRVRVSRLLNGPANEMALDCR